MKKANIMVTFTYAHDIKLDSQYSNINLIQSVEDLIEAHEVIHDSKFIPSFRETLLALKSQNEITSDLANEISRARTHSPETRVCFLTQLKCILSGDYISMNSSGGYFNFRPEISKILSIVKF